MKLLYVLRGFPYFFAFTIWCLYMQTNEPEASAWLNAQAHPVVFIHKYDVGSRRLDGDDGGGDHGDDDANDSDVAPLTEFEISQYQVSDCVVFCKISLGTYP